MKPFDWSAEKNQWLKRERQVTFEMVVVAILDGRLLSVVRHPNPDRFSHQPICVVEMNNYVYLVPFIEGPETIFLKTVYPSRKYTRIHLSEGR